VLINFESSVGAFLLVALLLLYLVIITLCILFIPTLAEYQP
jgi:competence protein ComGC